MALISVVAVVCLAIGFLFGRLTKTERMSIDHFAREHERIRTSTHVIAPMIDIRPPRTTSGRAVRRADLTI